MMKNNDERIFMKDAFLVIFSTIFAFILFFLLDFILSSWSIEDPDQSKPFLRLNAGWYELKKNFEGSDQWGGKKYPLRTDKDGFRINTMGSRKKYEKTVVLFLGDSFTYGINGAWNETFVGMIDSVSEYTIINGGVPSYSPIPYLYTYQKISKLNRLKKSHIVVVGLDISDVADESFRWREGDLYPTDISVVYVKEWSILKRFLKDHFLISKKIFRYFRSKLNPPIPKKVATDDSLVFNNKHSAFTWKDWKSIENDYAPLGVEKSLQKTKEVMIKIREKVKQNGGEFYILIYPFPAQLKYESKIFSWEGFAHELCEKSSCSGVINTFPKFRELAMNEPNWYRKYYIYGDAHFNKEGNRVLADEILSQLSSSKLLLDSIKK
jgi:hypothetical protein